MVALVRTPDRHEPVTSRTPSLKPSHNTCLQVAGLQEHATAPGEYLGYKKDTRRGRTSAIFTVGRGKLSHGQRKQQLYKHLEL